MSDSYFLGKGWSFPPVFNSKTKTVEMVSENDDVIDSLFIILSTNKKERILRPEFGSNLISVAFENIDSSFYHRIIDEIRTTLIKFEPRVDVLDIKLDNSFNSLNEPILYIHIEYMLRTTNSRHNIVYPYYLQQGTLLKE